MASIIDADWDSAAHRIDLAQAVGRAGGRNLSIDAAPIVEGLHFAFELDALDGSAVAAAVRHVAESLDVKVGYVLALNDREHAYHRIFPRKRPA